MLFYLYFLPDIRGNPINCFNYNFIIDKVFNTISKNKTVIDKIMDKPLLSIIVPVYNVEDYIRPCLDSLINQTLKNIEIICVNDASPDNSLEILNEYAKKDSRVKVINLSQNKHQGGARNEGIKVSSAEWISFVDSDDFVDISMYELMYKKAIETCSDIVICDYYEYYSQNNIKAGLCLPDSVLSQPKPLRDRQMLFNTFSVWQAIYRKKILTDNHLYFPEQLFYEDNAFVYVVHFLAEKISKVNKPLYYYRCSNVSVTRSYNNYNLFDRLTTANILKNNLIRFGLYDANKEEVDFLYTQLYYINTIYACITHFSPLPYSEFKKLKRNFYATLPNFRQNKYYKSLPFKRRFLIYVAEHNLKIASSIIKISSCLKKFVKNMAIK